MNSDPRTALETVGFQVRAVLTRRHELVLYISNLPKSQATITKRCAAAGVSLCRYGSDLLGDYIVIRKVQP